MESDLKQIRHDLETHSDWNKIYYLARSEREKYELIKKWLKEDFGFLDVVLDFKDYKKLDKLFSLIPSYKSASDKQMIKNIIVREYLSYTILNSVGIEKDKYGDSLKDVEKVLFEGDYNGFFEVCGHSFNSAVVPLLKLKALDTPNKLARIHFLFDEVTDITLQTNINDLFIYRSNIAMLGYTTYDLMTYSSTNGEAFLESPHDYSAFETEAKRKEYLI